jgi:hypothetical protein
MAMTGSAFYCESEHNTMMRAAAALQFPWSVPSAPENLQVRELQKLQLAHTSPRHSLDRPPQSFFADIQEHRSLTRDQDYLRRKHERHR